ncbi:DUF805 domain-containing protein [Acinetobacter bohemicus]|uniref:DUF805 domain-containing protein n=1 Tax=Acinetobacter sp. S4397-1 TaxID=2972915 RepID=UPI00209A9EF0|nr:DUF805 domain-containing protein [Acinetobacter sp. S4397-1]MCO8045748.1 DUF805 domain-containing protein [Acinetobacter sp. S4397-1]
MLNTIHDSGFKPAGRFSRRSYLAWNMLMGFFFLLIGCVIALMLPGINLDTLGSSLSSPVIILFIFLYGVAIYFSMVFTIRRLHDRNHSGWFSLLLLVPVVNILFALYLLFAPGDQQANQFGQPRTTRGWENVLAILYILVLILLFIATFMISGDPLSKL